MNQGKKRLRIGLLPPVADLYVRAWPQICDSLRDFSAQVAEKLREEALDVSLASIVSTEKEVTDACKKLVSENVDLLVVAMAPYCPSGVLAPVLSSVGLPIVLWPVQTMYELDTAKYDRQTVPLNHGVHAVQDLANVLTKRGVNFGVCHGHLAQTDFLEELKIWAKAGRAINAMRNANPLQIGGHFSDMLDLQVGEDPFMTKLGIKPVCTTNDDFAALLTEVDSSEISRIKDSYESEFDIDPDVDDTLLTRTAAGEAAVRQLMARNHSKACGLNFLELCNDKRIADALHVVASRLMNEGLGYAGEGDWVTAILVHAMQHAFGKASFTEMFSVGYADNRIVLRHWGEGNYAMARSKPRMSRSDIKDKGLAEFAIADFEFEPGPAALVNLNSTTDGNGKLITLDGVITPDHLPSSTGPRAVWKPQRQVRQLLTEYAYAGGSHHLALVAQDVSPVLNKISRLTGWSCIKL